METKTREIGEGLMAFYAEIDADYIPSYRRWHNCEHMAERVSIPGFLAGRRYTSLTANSPGFLMLYETATVDALKSDAYLAALDAPTEWTKEALAHFRKPARGVYRLLSVRGESDFFAAPWLLTIRFDSGRDIGREKAQAILESLIGDTVRAARFYELNDHIVQIKTAEKRIYGEKGTHKRYLIFLELAHGDASRSLLEENQFLAKLVEYDNDALVDEYSIDFHLRKE